MAMNIFYNEWTLLNSWMWLLHYSSLLFSSLSVPFP